MEKLKILFTFIFLISCNRPELEINSYFARGVLIDRKFCSSDSSQSYWIFNITNPYGDSSMKVFGEKIVLNDTLYNRVVKVKNLPTYYIARNIEYKPVFFNQKYILEFEVSENPLLDCFRNTNLSNSPELNVKQISVTN
jgi:hypothetical protein